MLVQLFQILSKTTLSILKPLLSFLPIFHIYWPPSQHSLVNKLRPYPPSNASPTLLTPCNRCETPPSFSRNVLISWEGMGPMPLAVGVVWRRSRRSVRRSGRTCGRGAWGWGWVVWVVWEGVCPCCVRMYSTVTYGTSWWSLQTLCNLSVSDRHDTCSRTALRIPWSTKSLRCCRCPIPAIAHPGLTGVERS